MPLFGGTRLPPAEESKPCPAWARDYLLFERVPKRATAERREFEHAVFGSRGEHEGIKNATIHWLGIKRLWLRHRAELKEEWKRLGRRSDPPGVRFETDDSPDFSVLGPDPREYLRDLGDA